MKFLEERPVGAIALVVPGMPMELPGMESGGNSEAYDVLLISANAAPLFTPATERWKRLRES